MTEHFRVSRRGWLHEFNSAVTHYLRLTLNQVAIEEKTNGIPAFQPLLCNLELPLGTLIAADAMHC